MAKFLSQTALLFAMAFSLLIAQLLLKQGLTQVGALTVTSWPQAFNLIRLILTTPKLIGGLCISALSTLMWLVALSRLELSFAVPVLSGIYYVLILLASTFVLGERVTGQRWAGALLLILALALISNSK
ncbi:MAG: 4-amino-4-deoxy-L-arabinose transferase [Acidobacteria bacterium]|nr:4-amino-4-deoxy-L-arabinose transferase [Acidobacteriota bacterium]MBI3427416.1 4-amino-4-deoxy-L-arabinose transferase [Acidobacteriota bacterium]